MRGQPQGAPWFVAEVSNRVKMVLDPHFHSSSHLKFVPLDRRFVASHLGEKDCPRAAQSIRALINPQSD